MISLEITERGQLLKYNYTPVHKNENKWGKIVITCPLIVDGNDVQNYATQLHILNESGEADIILLAWQIDSGRLISKVDITNLYTKSEGTLALYIEWVSAAGALGYTNAVAQTIDALPKQIAELSPAQITILDQYSISFEAIKTSIAKDAQLIKDNSAKLEQLDKIPTKEQMALELSKKADNLKLNADINELSLWSGINRIGTPINLPTPKWSLIGKIDIDIDAPLGIAWWNFKKLPKFKKIYLKYIGLKNKTTKKIFFNMKVNDTPPTLEVIFAGDSASNGLCGYLVADVVPNAIIYQGQAMGVESPTSYWLGGYPLTSNNPLPMPDIEGITSIMCGNGTGLLSAGKIEIWGLT